MEQKNTTGLLELPKDFLIREKLPVHVYKQPEYASVAVAKDVADLIRKGGRVVLGLATGSTPTGVYAELIRLHKKEGLSFKNVVSFNLDEYFPMDPTQIQSYNRFMREHLFDHIDMLPENINIPDGTLPSNKVEAYCQAYEEKIKQLGGIDIQLLGIGRSGHIGFNEPGALKATKTRLVDLDKSTRVDAASDFFGVEHVPHQAITMGIATILQSKRIVMMAFTEGKSKNVAKVVEGEVDINLPASFLQTHTNASVYVDEAAACELTRLKCPWVLTGSTGTLPIKYNPVTARKAVIWLSLTSGKPILKLVEEDYLENHLSALVDAYGPVPNLNLRVFRHLQNTITGWPGGRPDTRELPPSPMIKSLGASTTVPVTDLWMQAIPNILPPSRKVVVFSPHPDDDVISMGGTLIRLCEQGHKVHVVYQTSGNIAVWDEDAQRFANFATQFVKAFGIDPSKLQSIEDSVENFISSKHPAEVDSKEIQKIKGLIRQTEARAAARNAGVKPERIHFLELPFYETGAVKKKPLSEEDIEIVVKFLESTKPEQIYAAGDLSDPHGTHRVCLKAILAAIDRLKHHPWMRECEVWLYRGAWQEWEPERIEMAVPMSPHELMAKRMAIFKHQSQKDPPFFPGNDKREFWVRAEDRNRATAALYDKLGLQEFEGVEAFVRYHIDDVYGTNPIQLIDQ